MRSLLLLTLTKFYLFSLVIVTQKNTLKISIYILTIQLTWAYHNTEKEEEWYVYHVWLRETTEIITSNRVIKQSPFKISNVKYLVNTMN